MGRIGASTRLALSIAMVGANLIAFAIPGRADDRNSWLHWRGPTCSGVGNAKPPIEWSTTKNVKWKVEVPGAGSGSPIIVRDQVFVVTSVPLTNDNTSYSFELHCYDRETGKLSWKRVAIEARPHQGTHVTNNHASASPCSDGKHVYAHFGSRGLYCYTLDGDLVWKKMFGEMNTRYSFGEGSSPTLAGEFILVPWDHDGPSFLYALNKETGAEVWKAKRDEPTCWATPIVVSHDGKFQVVMNGQNAVRSYDLATGKELWRCAGQTERPAATPVANDSMVFVGSGFRGAFMGAFRFGGQGDIEKTDNVAWTISRDTPDVASPLLSEGRLYFYKEKRGILSCVDAATGTPHYMAKRVDGLGVTYASPVAAGGYVYLADRDGVVVVIKDSNRFEIVATNTLGEAIDATPAIGDRELFIRSAKHLYCISEPQ